MGRLLTLMTLLILGALAVRTQQPSPDLTAGNPNGVSWRRGSHGEKLSYVAGATDGTVSEAFHIAEVVRGGTCAISARAALPVWFHPDVTFDTIVKEMDSFYENGANISLPINVAFEYSQMKLSGATKKELDEYRSLAFEVISSPN